MMGNGAVHMYAPISDFLRLVVRFFGVYGLSQ